MSLFLGLMAELAELVSLISVLYDNEYFIFVLFLKNEEEKKDE